MTKPLGNATGHPHSRPKPLTSKGDVGFRYVIDIASLREQMAEP